MPNWQPNWNNVVWNWGAANDAVSALRRAAGLLEQTGSERRRKAQAATDEWRGFFRSEFDGDLGRMLSRAHDLAEEYLAAADRIAGASDRAHREQKRREAERARWQREKEAEERARRFGGGSSGGGGAGGTW